MLKIIPMNTFTKKLLAVVVLISVVAQASADKGVGRKNRVKTTLNITAPSHICNYIAFNLKSGLSYKGSLLNSRTTLGNSIMNRSIITYQKGNTTYIVPYKTKISIPDVQPGYTGVKIILRKK